MKKINPFFIRLFSGFFIVICLFLVACAIFVTVFFNNNKTLALEKANIEFLDDAKDFRQTLHDIGYTLDEFAGQLVTADGFDDASYIDAETARSVMRSIVSDRRQNRFSKYMATAFVYDLRRNDIIYEITGSYTSDIFFNQYYESEKYTSSFWTKQISSGDGPFVLHSADVFSTSREARKVDTYLLPVSCKPVNSENFIVVMLLDVNKLLADFGVSEMYSSSGEMLCGKTPRSEFKAEDRITGFGKSDAGYVFKIFDEEETEVGLIREVPKDAVMTGKISSAPWLVLLLFLALGTAVAILVSLKYSAPIAEIAEDFNNSLKTKDKACGKVKTLDGVRDGVRALISQNAGYISDVDDKESVLNSLFLQSRMRDVYTGIDNIEQYMNATESFFMIYLRVNYKEAFVKSVGSDSGKATFFLKHLIELHLKKSEVAATALQIENNGIVVVFNVSPDFTSQEDLARDILKLLENESEYAYFTVVVSDIHDDIDNVKVVYDNLLDISKYEKPIIETQILFEHDGKQGAGRFYFSVEDMGKLSALIQNGSEEEVLRKFEEIVDYNIKKDINEFELYLLCTEIVNCSVKLVNRVFHSAPATLNVSSVYRELNRAHTPGKCKEICKCFLQDIMEYIRQNKREDDYIISYILDYVDNHYSEDIYLNLFAEKLKLTGAYISSYFKEKMNVNLSDYVNNYRIKRALELSANPQNKNKDIAVMVGLPNINTFIRLFKKYTGYTPGEYRKKHYGDGYNK